MSPIQSKICSTPDYSFHPHCDGELYAMRLLCHSWNTKGVARINLSIACCKHHVPHVQNWVCRNLFAGKLRMLCKPDAYKFCARTQASQFCTELPLLHSILSVLFQFHGDITKAAHLRLHNLFSTCSTGPELLLTERVSTPPNPMEVPQVEQKIYGSTEQKFLTRVQPKSKINIQVTFWNILEMQECQIQPFVFTGFFSTTSFNKLFMGLGFVLFFSAPCSFLATSSLPRHLWVCSSNSRETALTW